MAASTYTGGSDMGSKFFARCMQAIAAAGMVGCANQPPVPFQLVDQQSIAHAGVFRTQDQSMDITIGGKNFHGFYIVATGTAVGTSEVFFSRRFRMVETVSNVSSNSARALLKALDGESITCEFLFQDLRAVGDCRSSNGKVYQLVATGS